MANAIAEPSLVHILESCQRIEAAQEHHRVLQNSLKAIDTSLESPTESSRIRADAVLAARDAAFQLGIFLEHCYNNIPVSLRPSQQSMAVCNKVLRIPELPERILLELDTPNLVVANQANRAMRIEIKRSHALQRKLYIRPDPAAYFAPLAGKLPLPYSASRSFRSSDAEGGKHQVNITTNMPGDSLQRSPQISAMLVCQPPVFEMRAEIGCRCMSDSNPDTRPAGRSELNVIKSDTGITLQQLEESTRRIQLWHQNCPMASVIQHKMDGTVRTSVHYTADLRLRQGDEILQRPLIVESDRIQRRDKFGPYIEAKLAAHNAGQRTPSFEEFQTNSIAPMEGQGSS